MNLREHIAALLATRRPGYALPGAFFADEALYQAELELIFARHWLFLASAAEIPEGGDYRTYQIGPYPIFLLRRDDGSIAALHNTCRHRGSRILQQANGICGATLMCPYHRWTYDLDGRVIGCGATGESPQVQPPLKSVHVRELAGLIFVCLAEEPPEDFADMAARMTPYLAPHGLTHARVARQQDIIEHGNWKLTIENNRECFHCAGHPELLCSLFDFFGDIDEATLTDAERAGYARFGEARADAEARWRRLGLPWQPIEELHGRTTALSHRAPGARRRGRVHDPRHARRIPPAARHLERGAARLAALSRAAERLVPFPLRSRAHVLDAAPVARPARWCAAPGSCTPTPSKVVTTTRRTSPTSGLRRTRRTRRSSPRRSSES